MTYPPFTGTGTALGPVIRVDPAELDHVAAAVARSGRELRDGVPALASAWQRAAAGLAGTATSVALGVCAGRASAVMDACAGAVETYARALASGAGHYRQTETLAVPAQRTRS